MQKEGEYPGLFPYNSNDTIMPRPDYDIASGGRDN